MYADKIKTVRGSNVIIHFLTPPFDTAPLQNKVQLLYRVIPSQRFVWVVVGYQKFGPRRRVKMKKDNGNGARKGKYKLACVRNDG